MMKYSEQFMEHIEYAFAAFCKIVLRNVAISAYRDFGRKQKYEVSLDYLMSETSFEPFATDNYFEQYVYEKPTVLSCKGKKRYKTLAARKTYPQSRLYQCFLSPYCVTRSMKKAGKKRFVSHSPFFAPCMAATLFQFVGGYCFMSSYHSAILFCNFA